MVSYQYEIGLDYATRTNVELLSSGFPPPRGKALEEHSLLRQSVDGRVYGDGFSEALWEWDYLPQAMLDILLAYLLTRETSPVLIKTRNIFGTYGLYTGIMHRPRIDEDIIAEFGGWRNVRIRFTHLEVYEVPPPPP